MSGNPSPLVSKWLELTQEGLENTGIDLSTSPAPREGFERVEQSILKINTEITNYKNIIRGLNEKIEKNSSMASDSAIEIKNLIDRNGEKDAAISVLKTQIEALAKENERLDNIRKGFEKAQKDAEDEKAKLQQKLRELLEKFNNVLINISENIDSALVQAGGRKKKKPAKKPKATKKPKAVAKKPKATKKSKTTKKKPKATKRSV